MNKLMIVLSVLCFSASSNAFDYRDESSAGFSPNQQEVIADRKLRLEAEEACNVSGAAWAAYGRALLKNGKQAHGIGTTAAYESTPPWWAASKRAHVTKVVAQLWKSTMSIDPSESFGNRWAQNTANIKTLNQFKSNFSSDLATKSFINGCVNSL